MMRRWFWILLVLAVTGCGGAVPVPFGAVAPHRLPAELAAWKGFRSARPAALVTEVGEYQYVLVTLGDCSVPGRSLRVTGFYRSGPHWWVEAEFLPRLFGAEPEAAPTAVVRLRLRDVAQLDRKGLILQEEGMLPMSLRLKEPGQESAPVREYVAADGYPCRAPIPGQ